MSTAELNGIKLNSKLFLSKKYNPMQENEPR